MTFLPAVGESMRRRLAYYAATALAAPLILFAAVYVIGNPGSALGASAALSSFAMAVGVLKMAFSDSEDRRRRNDVIERYLHSLPHALQDEYGVRGSYTRMQILAAIQRQRLDERWSDDAFVIFGGEREDGRARLRGHLGRGIVVALRRARSKDRFTIEEVASFHRAETRKDQAADAER